MKSLKRMLLVVIALVSLPAFASGQQSVRVASYNIKFLSTGVSNEGDRLEKLREVINRLSADIIGLQEIDNRAALELIFPPADWQIIIDDESISNQDVALVVRKPLRVIGLNPQLNANNPNFLFPGQANNSSFPDRRDLLFVEIGLPNQSETFFVMVHHAKARKGGRRNTDARRVGAARDIVRKLQSNFADRNFILLGDFNDNPDDRSLNIMETGNFNATGGPEETDGPLLINLMEPLVAAGHVSHGRTSANIVGNRVNTIDQNSRQRNNNLRGTNQDTGDILFDQLLIPMRMRDNYVTGSAKVFDDAVAVRGSFNRQASDHLPVFADFRFGSNPPDGADGARLRGTPLWPDTARVYTEQAMLIGEINGSTRLDVSWWRPRLGFLSQPLAAISISDYSGDRNAAGLIAIKQVDSFDVGATRSPAVADALQVEVIV